MRLGSLVIVGTGISVGQITRETELTISSAEKVLYCVADSATERLILRLNSTAESMYVFYGEGKPRKETYQQMVDRTLDCVRLGLRVCVVYYGHPGIFVNPSHRAIRLARNEGYSAKMLPAVSSLDCLFADLGFDPSSGCQMFEATDLLLRRRRLDVSSHTLLWQVAATGELGFSFRGFDGKNIPTLIEYLLTLYPSDHEVVIYEAAQYHVCDPVILRTSLAALGAGQKVSGIATLYIPPLRRNPMSLPMLNRLGLDSFLEGKRLIPLETIHSEAD